MPTGHSTAVSEPILDFQSGLTLERKSVQIKVVPDPSERCTTAIAVSGSLTPGLSLAIAGSFHLVTLPRKICAMVGPSSVTSPGLIPGKLRIGTTAPLITGNC